MKCSGLMKAIYILEELGDLLDSTNLTTVYYEVNNSITNATSKDSDYSGVIITSGKQSSTNITLNLCVESICAICVYPNGGNYQSVINEINNYYNSPLTIDIPCSEFCKYGFEKYLLDKYIEFNPSKRLFSLLPFGFNTPLGETSGLSVINLDDDIVWLLDLNNKLIYLVPLWKIIYTRDI